MRNQKKTGLNTLQNILFIRNGFMQFHWTEPGSVLFIVQNNIILRKQHVFTSRECHKDYIIFSIMAKVIGNFSISCRFKQSIKMLFSKNKKPVAKFPCHGDSEKKREEEWFAFNLIAAPPQSIDFSLPVYPIDRLTNLFSIKKKKETTKRGKQMIECYSLTSLCEMVGYGAA